MKIANRTETAKTAKLLCNPYDKCKSLRLWLGLKDIYYDNDRVSIQGT